MKTIKSVFLSVVLCSLMGANLVHANEGRKKDHGPKDEWMAKVFVQLNLTSDQKALLEANKQDKREARKASFEQMKALRQALNAELMKPELDMIKVNSINTQLKEYQARRADRRLQSILEVRKILTPEQFSKFTSMMDEQREKWKNKEGE